MGKDLLIGEVAAGTGLDRRTIRYYEAVGLLPKPPRKRTGHASSGYRLYSEEAVERLRLIKGARLLDLSLAEIGQLLGSLDGTPLRPHLRQFIGEKLLALEDKLKALELLRNRMERIRDVLAREEVDAQESCCDPLCGPAVCPPPLVKLERGQRREES